MTDPVLRDLIDAELARRGFPLQPGSARAALRASSDWADAPDDLPELARLAARLEPRLARIFRRVVGQARARVTLEQLEVVVGAGNAHAAAALFEEAGIWADLTPEMRRELTRAITAGAEIGASAGSAVGVDLSTAFDLVSSHAVEWAYNRTNEFVVEVSEAQRMVLRDIVGSAVSGETDVRGAARLIRDVVGLTSRQAGAVQNFRDRLVGEGVASDAVERRTEKYAAAQLKLRSQMIARSEILDATNQGQQSLWEEAKKQGLLDPARTRRFWLVTADGRLCPICERLDGETAPLDGVFKGGYMRPPAHVACRCAVSLVIS